MDAVGENVTKVLKLKIKGGGELDCDLDKVHDVTYQEALRLGLELLANKRMSKVTKGNYRQPEALRAAALEIAEENLGNMYEGNLKIAGRKASGKEPAAVMTEARRLAKAKAKEEIKAKGFKIAHIPAKDITAFANAMVANDPSWVALAKRNLEAAKSVVVSGIDFGAVKADPKLAAKANAKLEQLKQLSAKQAAKPKKRAEVRAQH